MAKPYYTPTHDKNGRKLSKAERRIANKAKYAATRAAKPAKAAKAKAKLNPRKVAAVAEAFDFSYIDACARTYEALPEPLPAAKPKRKKRKAKRISSNDRLEAQAQRLSTGISETYLPTPVDRSLYESKALKYTKDEEVDMTIFELAGGDPVAAARHSAFLGMGLDAVTLDDIL